MYILFNFLFYPVLLLVPRVSWLQEYWQRASDWFINNRDPIFRTFYDISDKSISISSELNIYLSPIWLGNLIQGLSCCFRILPFAPLPPTWNFWWSIIVKILTIELGFTSLNYFVALNVVTTQLQTYTSSETPKLCIMTPYFTQLLCT